MKEDKKIITGIHTSENISNLIYTIRNQQVMLDNDLAKIYNYEVKRLNEQVKRNINRFPEDFMFQLTREEVELVKSHFATSQVQGYFTGQYGGRRKLPYAFTEQGVYMLATVLKGRTAEQQSIFIMRAFREMRQFLANNQELFSKISKIELKQLEADKKFERIFQYIATTQKVKQKIFFNGQIYDAFSFLVDLVARSEKDLILIDNYVDITTLNILAKKNQNVRVLIFTAGKGSLTDKDIANFNAQYPKLTVKITNDFHDRFLIIDKTKAYHIGASIKDAGKKSFAITKLKDKNLMESLLKRLQKIPSVVK